jgi:hypothetical protein
MPQLTSGDSELLQMVASARENGQGGFAEIDAD